MRPVALILATVLASPVIGLPTNDRCGEGQCDGFIPEEWDCIAGNQKVWKIWCARYWSELWYGVEDVDYIDESDDPPNGARVYWDCTDVDNSKDCKLVNKEKE